jgi:peptidoglycan DL-endopeptidase CwlO
VRRLRLAIVCLTAVAVCTTTVPAATADHGQDAYPSQERVDRARDRAAATARDVGAIKAELLLANRRLEQAGIRAEQAAEAYNGAMWRLEEAQERLRQARADADQARRTVADQRDAIGALVAASYQQGSQLTALNAMMSADGPQGVLDQYAGFQGASSSLEADYQRFAAADALAQVFERKAQQAKVEQERLAADARVARDEAATAASQAQASADQVAAEKDRLIRELATAQDISVRLARERQTALEEIARQRAEARARREARAQARAEAAAQAEAAAAAKARAEAAARAKAAKAAKAAKTGNGGNDAPKADPAPAPTPPPASDPSPRGGAQQAIAFARAQLGEPYRWGASGPSSWDCSGLTQGAWGSAGVYLPHYSVAQYYAGTPVPVSDARPGDLLFWSSNGAPGGIHHVALSLGGGRFIEAPHTGANVRYNSIYAWYPDFAVRL